MAIQGEASQGRGYGGEEVRKRRSRAEAVERAALALERVDDVERGDGLALGVLGVGDRVADDVLEEAAASARMTSSGDAHLQHAARLLVDEA